VPPISLRRAGLAMVLGALGGWVAGLLRAPRVPAGTTARQAAP
jgi:hypothetical protein